MSVSLRTPIVAALAAVVAALLAFSVLQMGSADAEPTARAETVDGFYARTKKFACTNTDIGCPISSIVARCRSGDVATGGAAWRTEPGVVTPQIQQSRPHGGNNNKGAIGWKVDGGIIMAPDHTIFVKVLCIDRG